MRRLLVSIGLLVAPALAAPPAVEWDAVSATTEAEGFRVARGKASVEREGSKFVATIRDERGATVQVVQGTVQGQRVKATRSVMNSDLTDEPLNGTWVVQVNGRYTTETISLNNKWTLVGFTHTRVAPRKP